MNIQKISLIGGALVLSLAGAMVQACSSSNSPAGGDDAGIGGGSSSGGGTGSSSGGGTGSSSGGGTGSSSGGGTGSSSGSTSEDGGTTCKVPTLHPNPAGDVYCGFSSGDAGGDLDCLSDSGTPECCLGGTITGGYAPQACAAFGAACTNGTKAIPIECGQNSDCTANGVPGGACCLQGTTSGPTAIAGCPATDLKQQGGTGIVCEGSGVASGDGGADAGDAGASTGAGSCAAGEIRICAQDSDCPSGMTCTPMHWKLYDLGYCM